MSSNTNPNNAKDVIYIDVDDEITAIIDKVRSSGHRIVALVLPKRATMMQSIVNMKLLKRTADEAKKHIVLITSESSLLPLAGNVGIFVAKTLQSRPEVPEVGGAKPADDLADEESALTMEHETPKLDKSRSVGEYAATAKRPTDPDEDEDTIELDNAAIDEPEKPLAAAGATKTPKPKKDKKLKIPDFNKFRLALTLGVVGVLLLSIGLYAALVVMPKASVLVKTDSSAIQTDVDITFKTDAREADADAAVIPATLQQTQKTTSQTVDATGQKDVGKKATGTMKFYNCNQSDTLFGNDRTIPAGTGVSANGMTFVTKKTVEVPPSNFNQNNTCKKNRPSQSIDVTAIAAGEKYNMDATTYAVAGFSTISGEGSAMEGGTSEFIKIVSQADIDNAKQKIGAQDTAAIKLELQRALVDKGLYALDDTFTATPNPEVTTNTNVGAEANSVTVTQKTTYTMLGAKQDDLKKQIAHEVNQKIDTDKQSILDYGLDDAVFKLQNQQGTTSLVAMDVTSIAGSDLNVEQLKKQVAGKKSSEAKDIIGTYPGVTDVTVKYSPFWVSSIPKKTSKITLTIEKPEVKDAGR